MTIRGNYRLLYACQMITGILLWLSLTIYGFSVAGFAILPYVVISGFVSHKHQPDEREMNLSHRINSYSDIFIIAIAAVIYLLFPHVNWFFALISSMFFFRGIIGIILFSVR